MARPVLILALGMADQESMALWQPLSLILTVVLAIPALYTLHSVRVYFGLVRAMGGDHFRREYREMPLVEQGAYQWSSNAMYAFVFLGLWAAAFLTRSVAALSVALFQHAFIWVHFYCTEEPDMALIYGQE